MQRLRELLPDVFTCRWTAASGPSNAAEIREAGANLLVAGTSVFGQEDIAEAYRRLAQAIS